MADYNRSSMLSKPSIKPAHPSVPTPSPRNRHQRRSSSCHIKTLNFFPFGTKQSIRKNLCDRQTSILCCFRTISRCQLSYQSFEIVRPSMYLLIENHRVKYRSNIPIEEIVVYICDIKQYYTQIGGSRPFGAAFLFAGYDKNGKFQLYSTDPSGNYAGWKATAIGSNHIAANSFLKQ